MQEIDINLKPSMGFLILAAFCSMWNILIVFWLPLSLLIKVVILILIFVYTGYIVWRFGLLKDSDSITQIRLNDKGWHFNDREVEILGDSTLTTWVSVLRFKQLNKRQKASTVVFRDSMGFNNYRRLLVALKSARPPKP